MDISTNDVDNDTKKNCTCVMDTNDEQKNTFYKTKKIYLNFPFR